MIFKNGQQIYESQLTVYRGFSPYANFITANFITAIFQNFPKIFGLCNFMYYRMRAIISRGLYIFYPIFNDHFFVFKEVFSENSVLMYGLYLRAACNQERLMMVRVRYLSYFLTNSFASELHSFYLRFHIGPDYKWYFTPTVQHGRLWYTRHIISCNNAEKWYLKLDITLDNVNNISCIQNRHQSNAILLQKK